MSKETGGNAFPSDRLRPDGMTLRDYFAAKAMEAIMANEDELNRICCSYSENKQRIAIAYHAYAIADAMIEARSHDKD